MALRVGTPPLELDQAIRDLEWQMKEAAKMLEFEKAAMLRDQVVELKGIMAIKRTQNDRALLDYN